MNSVLCLLATFPVRATQPVRQALAPYLLYDAELAGLEVPDPAHRRLRLHPRVRELSDVEEGVRATCAELGVLWSIGIQKSKRQWSGMRMGRPW